MTALANALIALGLALLDKRLDKWIDTHEMTGAQRDEMRRIENEMIAALSVVLKNAAPRAISILGRAIRNDPKTGTWA